MTSSGAKLNPQICPSNPDLVAYICNHDIWVAHTVSGCNVRLTYAHKGGRNLADDPLCAGVPSYVMQEEFCRYQGYWWQPTCTGELKAKESYLGIVKTMFNFQVNEQMRKQF